MFPLAPRVLAALALAALAAQGNATAPTTNDCKNAWTSSSASQSCGEDNSTYYLFPKSVSASVDTSIYDVVAHNNECRVKVDCVKSDTAVPVVSNEFSGSTDEVGDLSNCDGSLKVGNC